MMPIDPKGLSDSKMKLSSHHFTKITFAKFAEQPGVKALKITLPGPYFSDWGEGVRSQRPDPILEL